MCTRLYSDMTASMGELSSRTLSLMHGSLSLYLSLCHSHSQYSIFISNFTSVSVCYTHDSTQFVCVSHSFSRFRSMVENIFPLILATDDILYMDVCRFALTACLPARLIGCLAACSSVSSFKATKFNY